MRDPLTQRCHRWCVAAPAAALLLACSVNPLPTPAADAAGSTGVAPGADLVSARGLDAAALPDEPWAEDAADPAFCTGASRVELDGEPFTGVSVTTAEIAMDCCSGFVTRFHTAAAAGIDLSVTLTVAGLDAFVGDFDLSDVPEGVVSVRSGTLPDGSDGDWEDFDGVLAGTLSVRDDGVPPARRVVTLCLAGERAAPAAGAPFQRVRLYAADIGLLVPWDGGESGFALHLLADPALTAAAAAERPLAELELSAAPTVDLDWVEYYELATHHVVLSPWRNGESLRSTLPPVGTRGLPFVAVSGGERLYLGAFWTSLSSEAAAVPVIVVESIERSGFHIEGGYPVDAGAPADPRADPRLLAALRYLGKLVDCDGGVCPAAADGE